MTPPKIKICLIGNNAFGAPAFDGQRAKLRTYKAALEKEGFDVFFVELDKTLLRFFKIMSDIKKGIKECDIIVLITSDNGERILIPHINRINKKYGKRFVFSQIGTSFLYKYIKPMSEERKKAFFEQHDFSGLNPEKKVQRELKKVDVILTETELINGAFKDFFGLDNCYALTNFRLVSSEAEKEQCNGKLIFLSRIMTRKGIFDLLNVLNKTTFSKLRLDIYGRFSLNKAELDLFNSKLNERIKYCGELLPDQVIDTIKQYDMLCFPTLCEGEGTPGCIVESLIAGTPVLSSNFSQSGELLRDGYDSIIYKFGDAADLESKLQSLAEGKVNVKLLKENAKKSGERFTYDYNRVRFLSLITGEEI